MSYKIIYDYLKIEHFAYNLNVEKYFDNLHFLRCTIMRLISSYLICEGVILLGWASIFIMRVLEKGGGGLESLLFSSEVGLHIYIYK